jgi:hypothetical protein
VDVLVQEKEEVPNEEDGSHENGNDSNNYDTAFDWEASAA